MSFVQEARAYQEQPHLIEGLLADEPESFRNLGEVDHYRPELYSLLAIMIDDIMDDFEDGSVPCFPPYGFFVIEEYVGEATEFDNFMQAYEALRQTFLVLGSSYLSAQAEDRTPLYLRTEALCDLFREAFPSMNQYESPAKLVGAGINTAAIATIESLKAISRVSQAVNPDVTNEEIAEIARHSERILFKPANLPVTQILGIELLINQAANKSSDSDSLDCYPMVYRQTVDGQGYVDYAEPISRMTDPTDSEGRSLNEARPMLLKRLGCPALAHLDGNKPSVVQRLWRHMIDVAEAEELFTMAPDIYMQITAQ